MFIKYFSYLLLKNGHLLIFKKCLMIIKVMGNIFLRTTTSSIINERTPLLEKKTINSTTGSSTGSTGSTSFSSDNHKDDDKIYICF